MPSALVAGAKTHTQVSDSSSKLVTKMKELEERLAKKQRAVKDGLVSEPIGSPYYTVKYGIFGPPTRENQ